MKVIGLNHRGIRTAKLEDSRHFYEDLLGLKQGHRPAALTSEGYWLNAGESPVIHLVEDSDGSSDGTNTPKENLRGDLTDAGGQTHLALTVEKARDAVDRLIKAGVPYWDRQFKNPVMLSHRVSVLLPLMLIVGAAMSQFSAAVVDTLGGGGLLVEESWGKLSPGLSHLAISVCAIALIWTTSIF